MNNRGYTLLISVIVSSIVLSIAVFIVTAARKQAILSSVASDSTLAIYAADSAIQCAVEAYNKGNIDPSNPNPVILCGIDKDGNVQSKTLSYSNDRNLADTYATANGISLNTSNSSSYPYAISSTDNSVNFTFPQTGVDDGTCATITVVDGYNSSNKHMTVIDARGYNMFTYSPCDPGSAYNPRLVERQIRLTLY
ncbi:MAG: hypothetical protein M1459_01530 [Patescibacteria group bacterium]|nr:hypothetical protein [Patescibacteria group bacterium]